MYCRQSLLRIEFIEFLGHYQSLLMNSASLLKQATTTFFRVILSLFKIICISISVLYELWSKMAVLNDLRVGLNQQWIFISNSVKREQWRKIDTPFYTPSSDRFQIVRTSASLCDSRCLQIEITVSFDYQKLRCLKQEKKMQYLESERQAMKLTFQRAAGNAKTQVDRIHLHSCGQFYSGNGWLMSVLKWNVLIIIKPSYEEFLWNICGQYSS